jgi:hypothetical protein
VSVHHPIAEQWRREADSFERRGQTSPAAMLRSCAEDLEYYEVKRGLEELTLKEAAKESGYSTSQLARQISDGKLENVGKKGAPRVRRCDLPMKPLIRRANGDLDLVPTLLGESAK